MEGRGHDPPRQAVVQAGGHTPFQVRQAQGHGGGSARHGILQHGVDRQLGEARRDREEHRKDGVPHTRRAGLPLLLHSRRRKRRAEGMRRKMAGVRPAQGREGTRGVALRVLRAEHRMTAI